MLEAHNCLECICLLYYLDNAMNIWFAIVCVKFKWPKPGPQANWYDFWYELQLCVFFKHQVLTCG